MGNTDSKVARVRTYDNYISPYSAQDNGHREGRDERKEDRRKPKEDRKKHKDQKQGRKKGRKEHTKAGKGKTDHDHDHDPSAGRTDRTSRRNTRPNTSLPRHAATRAQRVGDEMMPPVPPYQVPPSTEETFSRRKGDEITSREPQHCRELIRKMHELNLGVWKGRNGFEADAGLLRDKHRRATAAQAEINDMIQEWIEQRGQWTPDEWQLVMDIQDLMSGIEVVQRPV